MTLALVALPLLPLIVGIALGSAARVPARIAGPAAAPIATVTMLVVCVLAVVVARSRPSVDREWVPQLGIRLHLGVDGLSIPLVLLTAFVGLLVAVHAIGERPATGTRTSYAACVLIVVAGAMATFLSRDLVLFFVAFELVLVPMWFLIGKFGDRRDPALTARAARLFMLYTVLGSTLMLVGILTAVHLAGTSDLGMFAARVPAGRQMLVATILLAGLAVKVPLWPLHSWLPAAHTAAPTGGSMLLAAVLLKMGTYGVIRLVVPLHEGWARLAPIVGVLAVVGIVLAGLVCLVETSLKRLIAWSSIGHMGLVMLALATGSVMGVQAALFGNIAHGVISALLFAVVGALKTRWHGDDLTVARAGLRDTAPRLGFALLVALAAGLGLPGLAGFWGELFTVISAWSPAGHPHAVLFRVLGAAAALGAVLTGAYCVRVIRLVWAGERQTTTALPDAGRIETTVVGLLLIAVVTLGVWPGGLFDLGAPVVRALLGVAGR